MLAAVTPTSPSKGMTPPKIMSTITLNSLYQALNQPIRGTLLQCRACKPRHCHDYYRTVKYQYVRGIRPEGLK